MQCNAADGLFTKPLWLNRLPLGFSDQEKMDVVGIKVFEGYVPVFAFDLGEEIFQNETHLSTDLVF